MTRRWLRHDNAPRPKVTSKKTSSLMDNYTPDKLSNKQRKAKPKMDPGLYRIVGLLLSKKLLTHTNGSLLTTLNLSNTHR
jgi:hypothetical protein